MNHSLCMILDLDHNTITDEYKLKTVVTKQNKEKYIHVVTTLVYK